MATVRVRRGLPTLRRRTFVQAFKRSLAECCVRDGFRLVHDSIQRNHLHVLIEARGKEALGRPPANATLDPASAALTRRFGSYSA